MKDYYESADHVLFVNPIVRLLAKVFGNERYIIRCKTCNKIPVNLYGDYCLKCKIN